MKRCIHQVMRPKEPILREGVGDCRICTPDEKNKECRAYYPITWAYVNVEEDDELT
jgi:hypothetical protein